MKAEIKQITKNPMRNIRIEKITLNIGAGASQDEVKKAMSLLNKVSGKTPIETLSKKRIATWKVRIGLPIGSKVTVRGSDAEKLLKRLLESIGNKLKRSCFNENGFNFGIKEYIDVPGVKYDPKIGIIGFDVCVTLERPGFRVKRRKIKPARILGHHKITADDSIQFARDVLKVEIE